MQGRKPVIKPLGEGAVVDLPTSAVRVPVPPATLVDPVARQCWDEVARVMVAKNIYDDDCAHMLEAFCVQRARFLDADAKVREKGQIHLSKARGQPMHNPWLSVSNAAFSHMVKLGSELGLTPVSRQRAAKANRKAGAAPASKFLKGA
jgi:P27 family predicted phage terminase small subunit